MTVAMPSTPASHFHLLRQQAYQRPRRPLVVFTPKSMLRLKAATSAVEDFTSGTFRAVVPEERLPEGAAVDRVLLCAGKVYWDLLAHREKTGDTSTAIVRLEQLYPLDRSAVAEAIAPYGQAELVWVQEEPANQGAWTYIKVRLPRSLGRDVRRISRTGVGLARRRLVQGPRGRAAGDRRAGVRPLTPHAGAAANVRR